MSVPPSTVPVIDCAMFGPVPKNPFKDLTGPSNVVLAIMFLLYSG